MVKDSCFQCTILFAHLYLSLAFENTSRISFMLLCFVVGVSILPVHTNHSWFPPSSFPLRLPSSTQRHTAPRGSGSLRFPLPFSILAHKARRTTTTQRWCFEYHSLFRWYGLLVFGCRDLFHNCRHTTHTNKSSSCWGWKAKQRSSSGTHRPVETNTHPTFLRSIQHP